MQKVLLKIIKESKVEIMKVCKKNKIQLFVAIKDEDFEFVQNYIIQNKEKNKINSKLGKKYPKKIGETKKVECLKCHKTFVSEIDKMGVAYNRICPECTRSNLNVKNVLASVGKSSSNRINSNY